MTSRASHARWTAGLLRVPALLPFLLLPAGAMAIERHAVLPPPVNLGADGKQAAKQGQPVVILFSLPGCAFCDVVRQNYLAPLMRDMPEAERPIIREVRITDTAKFSGFNLKPVSHRELAARYGAHFAPTVVMLDGEGNLLAQPIVGGDMAGLYGAYLDNALAEASRKMAGNRTTESKGRTQ